MSAAEALSKALDDLVDLCTHIKGTFSEKVQSKSYRLLLLNHFLLKSYHRCKSDVFLILSRY